MNVLIGPADIVDFDMVHSGGIRNVADHLCDVILQIIEGRTILIVLAVDFIHKVRMLA